MAVQRVIPAFVGDDIVVRVDVVVNGVPGEDLTGGIVEAEWQTPTPVTPTVDTDGLPEGYFLVQVSDVQSALQVAGRYTLYARMTLPNVLDKFTVLNALVDLQAQPITAGA